MLYRSTDWGKLPVGPWGSSRSWPSGAVMSRELHVEPFVASGRYCNARNLYKDEYGKSVIDSEVPLKYRGEASVKLTISI